MFASFFDINNVFFVLWGYPMSYLEFFGTILNILTVWLCTKKNVWNWPISIVAVVLFGILFYQIQLYSDLLEQVFYLVTGFWGWWAWSMSSKKVGGDGKDGGAISVLSRGQWGWVIVFLGLGTIALGWFIANIHILFPTAFSEPASFPYLDAFTTVASFAAQVLLIFQKLENWYLWIMVDVIGVGLYFVKEVKFVAALYFLFFFLAVRGLLLWQKKRATQLVFSDTKIVSDGKEVPVV